MAVSEKELDSAVELTPEKRYSYFIKRVCDYQEVWVLKFSEGGYALSIDNKDKEYLYLFPFEEFVEFFQSEDDSFEEFAPQKIKLSKFIEKTIPGLQKLGVKSACVFPVPDGYGLNVDFLKLIRDIESELEEWYVDYEGNDKDKVKVKKLKD